MNKPLSLFERVLVEAPDDAPDMPTPDEVTPEASPPPPDLDDTTGGMDAPDIGGEDSRAMDAPPDLAGPDEMMEDDLGGDGGGFDDSSSEDSGDPKESLNVDEKISTIMNQNLYQKFLTLLNTIGIQISSVKNNNDVLFAISPEITDTVESFKKLDENLRLYLTNQFEYENYSQNLLFFNKCVNLLKLLNDILDKSLSKGIRGME